VGADVIGKSLERAPRHWSNPAIVLAPIVDSLHAERARALHAGPDTYTMLNVTCLHLWTFPSCKEAGMMLQHVRPWFARDPAAGITIWDYRTYIIPRNTGTLCLSVRVPFKCLLCRRRAIYEWAICGFCWQRVRSGLWAWLTQYIEENAARIVWGFLY
jgi:hypothetical protein